MIEMTNVDKVHEIHEEEEQGFIPDADEIEQSFLDRQAEIEEAKGLFAGDDLPEPEELAEDSFTPVPEYVLNLLNEVREQYHSHLSRAKISVLFREARWKSKGRTVFAKTEAIKPAMRLLTGFDFQMVINREEFESGSDNKKRAVLDQELCRCDYKENQTTGEMIWKTNTPDLEGFIENISRHGFWTDELRNAKTAFDQKSLFDQKEDLED